MEQLSFIEEDDAPKYTSQRSRVSIRKWMDKKMSCPHTNNCFNQDEALVCLDSIYRGFLTSYDFKKIKEGKTRNVKHFIVSGIAAFYRSYCNLDGKKRIHYENVLCGERKTFTVGKEEYERTYKFGETWSDEEVDVSALAHFYADIDANKAYNPDLQFDKVFDDLVAEFREFYKTQLNEPDYPIIHISDASGPDKYSRHLLVKSCTGDMFKNGSHVGAFYRSFILHIINKYGNDDTNPFIIWNGEHSDPENKVLIMDPSVYTRYRGFRMFFSTKIGQERPLLPYNSTIKHPSEMPLEVFANRLIQFSSLENVGIIEVQEPNDKKPQWSSINPLNILKYDVNDGKWTYSATYTKVASVAYSYVPKGKHISFFNGMIVDNVITKVGEAIAASYHGDGVRSCKPMNKGHGFVFQSRNQQDTPCPFEGSNHESNHIKYNIFIFDKYLKKTLYYNITCFSQKCSGKRTKNKPIANVISTALFEDLSDYCDRVLNDDVMCSDEYDVLFPS